MSPEPASSKSLTSQKRNGKEFLCENKLNTESDFFPPHYALSFFFPGHSGKIQNSFCKSKRLLSSTIDFQMAHFICPKQNGQKESYSSNKDGIGKMGNQKPEFFYCLRDIFFNYKMNIWTC